MQVQPPGETLVALVAILHFRLTPLMVVVVAVVHLQVGAQVVEDTGKTAAAPPVAVNRAVQEAVEETLTIVAVVAKVAVLETMAAVVMLMAVVVVALELTQEPVLDRVVRVLRVMLP